jgi:hypothetical protein
MPAVGKGRKTYRYIVTKGGKEMYRSEPYFNERERNIKAQQVRQKIKF